MIRYLFSIQKDESFFIRIKEIEAAWPPPKKGNKTTIRQSEKVVLEPKTANQLLYSIHHLAQKGSSFSIDPTSPFLFSLEKMDRLTQKNGAANPKEQKEVDYHYQFSARRHDLKENSPEEMNTPPETLLDRIPINPTAGKNLVNILVELLENNVSPIPTNSSNEERKAIHVFRTNVPQEKSRIKVSFPTDHQVILSCRTGKFTMKGIAGFCFISLLLLLFGSMILLQETPGTFIWIVFIFLAVLWLAGLLEEILKPLFSKQALLINGHTITFIRRRNIITQKSKPINSLLFNGVKKNRDENGNIESLEFQIKDKKYNLFQAASEKDKKWMHERINQYFTYQQYFN